MNFEFLFLIPVLFGLAAATPARSASFYSQRLEDANAVYIAPSGGGDDTAALQQAINRVQETTGQGIVLLAPGQYHIRDTIYIWPGIRLIGYGAGTAVDCSAREYAGLWRCDAGKTHDFFRRRAAA